MIFIGPDGDTIYWMGLKHVARDLATAANVPVIRGSGLLESAGEALTFAQQIGFPVSIVSPSLLSRVTFGPLRFMHSHERIYTGSC